MLISDLPPRHDVVFHLYSFLLVHSVQQYYDHTKTTEVTSVIYCHMKNVEKRSTFVQAEYQALTGKAIDVQASNF